MEFLTEPLGAHRSNQSDGTYPRTQWATLLGTVFNLLWLNTTVWKKVEREAVGARRAAGGVFRLIHLDFPHTQPVSGV